MSKIPENRETGSNVILFPTKRPPERQRPHAEVIPIREGVREATHNVFNGGARTRAKTLSSGADASPKQPRKTKKQMARENQPRGVTLPQQFKLIIERMSGEGLHCAEPRWPDPNDTQPATPNLTIKEVEQALVDLKTNGKIDTYQVARILFRWLPPERFNEKHIRSVVALLKEGNEASAFEIIREIARNPRDIGQLQSSTAAMAMGEVDARAPEMNGTLSNETPDDIA